MSVFESLNNTTDKATDIGERYIKASHQYLRLKIFQQLTSSVSLMAKVLIIGGFTSVPGAICGGLIIGLGEKIFEIYWGPMMGGSVEGWFAYVIALVFLLFKPQGLFGEKIIERV